MVIPWNTTGVVHDTIGAAWTSGVALLFRTVSIASLDGKILDWRAGVCLWKMVAVLLRRKIKLTYTNFPFPATSTCAGCMARSISDEMNGSRHYCTFSKSEE